MTERIGNPKRTLNDPLGHRRQQPGIPFISPYPADPPEKPVLASATTPDGVTISLRFRLGRLGIHTGQDAPPPPTKKSGKACRFPQ
jgi:hypothetical protein